MKELIIFHPWTSRAFVVESRLIRLDCAYIDVITLVPVQLSKISHAVQINVAWFDRERVQVQGAAYGRNRRKNQGLEGNGGQRKTRPCSIKNRRGKRNVKADGMRIYL